MAELKSPNLRKNLATNFAPSVLFVSLTNFTADSGLFKKSKCIRTAAKKKKRIEFFSNFKHKISILETLKNFSHHYQNL